MPYAARMTSRSSSSDRTSMKLGGDGASYHLLWVGGGNGWRWRGARLVSASDALFLQGWGCDGVVGGRIGTWDHGGGIVYALVVVGDARVCGDGLVGPRFGRRPRREGRRWERRRRRRWATKRRLRACGWRRRPVRGAAWMPLVTFWWIPRGARWRRARARLAGSSSGLNDAPAARERVVAGGAEPG